MKKIFQLICLFLVISCSNKKNNSEKELSHEVVEKDIYFAINMVLNDMEKTEMMEENKDSYLVDKLSMPSYIDENRVLKKRIDSIYSGDFSFINTQLNQWKDLKLIQDSIKFKKLISSDLLKNMINQNAEDRKSAFIVNYQKKFGKKYFYRLSIPIFSRDKRIFLVDINFLNGGGSYIYKWKKNKWIHYQISYWIS